MHVTGATRGTVTDDDLPSDGSPDATSTFASSFHDIVFSSGKEVHGFTLNGSGTTVATGALVRFHVLVELVLDENGNPKIDFLRLTCF